MSLSLYLSTGVLGGNRKSGVAHRWKIDDVVADKCGFVQSQARLPDDLLECTSLVVDTLEHEFELQVAGAESDGFRKALRDEPGTKPPKSRERDGHAIVRVEAFELDRTLCAKLSVLLCFLVLWEKEHLAVGEDAVDVE